jgi:putative zinc finger/helix-turn-helix YgiT family protein
MDRKTPKCGNCRQARYETVVAPYTAQLEHDGRSYEITLGDLTFFRCPHCGSQLLPDEAEERLFETLRQNAGLLRPSEIESKRIALGLTQKVLADLFEIAEATLARWETGAQIQPRHMDKMLRAFFEVEPFRQFLADAERGHRPQMV